MGVTSRPTPVVGGPGVRALLGEADSFGVEVEDLGQSRLHLIAQGALTPFEARVRQDRDAEFGREVLLRQPSQRTPVLQHRSALGDHHELGHIDLENGGDALEGGIGFPDLPASQRVVGHRGQVGEVRPRQSAVAARLDQSRGIEPAKCPVLALFRVASNRRRAG